MGKTQRRIFLCLISCTFLCGLIAGAISATATDKTMTESANPMQELRSKIFATDPKELGLAPSKKRPHIWGVLMEIGYPEATATLVALGEGTVSFYFSNGGGIIGAGEHMSVRNEAAKFIDSSEECLDQLSPASTFPLPSEGRVRFYVLTFSGPLTVDAAERELGEGKHPLSRLFYAGHKVITEIRQISEPSSR